jgi:transglutaminase-like putative cysteine protease
MFKYFYTGVLIFLFMQSALGAKEIKYPVSAIPDSLKINAKAVMRDRSQVFEIKSVGKGIETVTYAITILNENGIDYATFREYYSQKLHKIHSIKGTIYNAAGEKIETMAPDKIFDLSAISGYSLYEDNRVKRFEPKTLTCPFTVEYSFVREYDGLLNLPTWDPIEDYNVSVENSEFTMICPSNLSFRYIENNLSQKAEVVKSDDHTSFTWKIRNQVAMVEQPLSEPSVYFCPNVITAPDDFEIEGYGGNSSSWENLGKWANELHQGRDIIPEGTISQIKDLVKDCPSDYDKAKKIYEYMQNKTRYVNVTVGLGGWQPIAAEAVDRLGYGDCKALSNYAKALLNAVGIKAYCAWVLAGPNPEKTNVSFPRDHFNHVIVCVPLKNDTLWLECTNQHMPFNFLGDFTDDRDALVIIEEGGKLMHTHCYSARDNTMQRNAALILDPSGNATLITKSCSSGLLYEDKLEVYLAGTEDKKKAILNDVNLPGASIVKFDYQNFPSEIPSITESLELDIPRYATLTGTRMLVSLMPLDRMNSVPKKVSNRKSGVVIGKSEINIDSVTIAIPEGYQVEAIPSPVKIESRFGSYSLQPIVQGDKILCIRRLELKKGDSPAATYPELIDFCKKMASADNTKLSLKKNGA